MSFLKISLIVGILLLMLGVAAFLRKSNNQKVNLAVAGGAAFALSWVTGVLAHVPDTP